MRFPPHSSLLVGSTLLLALAAAGCEGPMPEDTPSDRPGGDVTEADQAIINGEFDGENEAVCALMAESGQGLYPFCTGTIFAKSGSTAHVISAAHCIEEGADPDYIVCADSYDDCPGATCKVYEVTAVAVHPQYDGSPSYDASIITITGAADAPFVPPLETDGLANDDPLEFSGYGVTNGFNETPSDQRNHSFSIVGELYLDAIEAPQGHSGQYGGTCFGDSGGPVLIGTGASKNIVGITSQGDQNCDEVGYYTRIQYIWDFVGPYVGGEPPQDCLGCANDSLSAACAAQADACEADAECNPYWTCVNGCNDDACFQQCGASYPNGAALYASMIDCAFCQACDAICQDPACDGGATAASTGTGDTTAGAGGGGGSGGASSEDDDDDDDDGDGKDRGGDETTTTTCTCAVPGGGAGSSNPSVLVGIALAAGLVSRRRRR